MDETSGDAPQLFLNGRPLAAVPPIEEWQAVTFSCTAVNQSTGLRLRVGTEDLGAPVQRHGDALWRWVWNPAHRTGTFQVVLTAGTVSSRGTLTVLPAKLDELQYEQLLQDIESTALALMLALGGGEVGAAGETLATPRSLLLAWPLLERAVDMASDCIDAIARSPHQLHRRVVASRPLHELDAIDGPLLAALMAAPHDDVRTVHSALPASLQTVGDSGTKYMPHSVVAPSTVATTDCFEHRFLHGLVVLLERRVAAIGPMIRREQERRRRSGRETGALDDLVARQRRALRRLRQQRAVPLFEGVPPVIERPSPSHLMRYDRRYRAVYRLWQTLNQLPRLAVDSPLFSLPLADTPTLYERWCLLRAATTLTELGEVEQQSLFRLAPEAGLPWTLSLAENCPLLVLRLADGGIGRLFYQRRYHPHGAHEGRWASLDPFLRIPDIAIEIERDGLPARVILLDAKYRVMPDGSLPEEALDAAYTYRGTVAYNGRLASAAVWLLFPGTKTIEVGPVGAIPLRPGDSSALQRLLEQAVRYDAPTT